VVVLETKVILTILGESIARATSVREAYNFVQKAANVEGVNLPAYDEMRKEIEEIRKKGG
jgi:predicted methyltransferase